MDQELPMNQDAPLPLAAFIRNKTRSIGVKLLFVSFLAMLMAVPAFFVASIVEDRTTRANDVTQEISGRSGGQQTFLGPVLCIPYIVPPLYKGAPATEGVYLIFPAQAETRVKLRTEERHRSLFKVPVFQADLQFDAAFDVPGTAPATPPQAVLDWSRASIIVGASNARAALADSTVMVNGKSLTLAPAESIGDANSQSRMPLSYFAAPAADFARPRTAFRVSAGIRFSGAQRIAVLPYGKTSHVVMEGDWPNPSFDGGFLPTRRSVSSQGFTAEWLVPFIARGVRAVGTVDVLSPLEAANMGVSFVEVADPYQSVNRALKYIPLFVGLVFLSYFIFEVTAQKRVHPAQYVLVGVAQLIFYLLLLSLAEHIGFSWGFLVASGATVVLLSANTSWIFRSRLQGLRALVIFSLLYVFIYLLLRLEDNALLVGALASFLAVAAVMYFTRTIDWYSSLASPGERST
jgi:inner membrane protein